MSSVIPKEKLSAYQRWELASFGEAAPLARQEQNAQNEQQLAAELAAAREEARRQGHAEGFEEGRRAGQEAGRAEVLKEAAQLRQITANFTTETGKANENVAEELLTLGLDLAKAMLKTALKVRPELMLPIVSEAIRYLPSVQQPALLVLHPKDAQIVRTHLADELDKAGWRVAEDVQMAQGGCRIETATNQIDATIEMRWQRLAESLGRQDEWLE